MFSGYLRHFNIYRNKIQILDTRHKLGERVKKFTYFASPLKTLIEERPELDTRVLFTSAVTVYCFSYSK